MPLPELSSHPEMSLTELVIRVTLGFWVLLTLTRIMGRKQVSQLTFFDYTTGITIGSIAAVLAVDNAIPVRTGILALLVWVAWVMLINLVTLHSVPARKIIDGQPLLVIHNGQILEHNLRSRYLNVNDLLMQLRENGVFDLNEVQIAIAEADGQLSILKKASFQTVTAQDLGVGSGQSGKPFHGVGKELILDGRVVKENLRVNRVDEFWLRQELRTQGVKDIAEVTVAMLNPDGTLYVDTNRDRTT